MASGKDNEEETQDKDKFDGSCEKLQDFDLQMGRWCRKKYGTKLGNHFWCNDLPDIDALMGADWDDYVEQVWDAINDQDAVMAKNLYPIASGFWTKRWHRKWNRKQFDKIFDKVEGLCTGAALLEVHQLGMDSAQQMRAHLVKQFGGAGDDVRAREQRYSDGMPKSKNQPAFPANVNMEDKLRELQAERIDLWKMCVPSKRDAYEYGKESTLVKLVLKHLRNTKYDEAIEKLLSEIKIRQQLKAMMPVFDPGTGTFVLPDPAAAANTDDWEYRNYSDDWLPSWLELKSKLISEYKLRQFSAGCKDESSSGKLPVMLTPGFGTTPKMQCFGCGEHGHRKGDPVCSAGPNDWAECAPKKWLKGAQGKKFPSAKGTGAKRKGADGMSNKKKGDGICYQFRDTGKCGFGVNCKFKHEPAKKKVKLTKAEKKTITVAAVQSLKDELKKKAKDDGVKVGESELASYLSSLMRIQTIPRVCYDKIDVEVSSMATMELLNTATHACHDSGSGTGISTDARDFVYVDDSAEAANSVQIRGPSVGAPECGGRGPMVFRVHQPVNHGIVHPDGVLAVSDVKFRVASERICNKRGLRFVGGGNVKKDILECVKSGKVVPMETAEDILVLETVGYANEVKDSPEFREVVDEVRRGVRSPLVNLEPFLPVESGGLGEQPQRMSAKSFLCKFLMLTTMCMAAQATVLIFNESKIEPAQRSRLWSRRFAYRNSAVFKRMASMPEYGGFPSLPELNEDDIIMDLSKMVKKSHPRNDPEVTMQCPPWWRIFLDGYGGQGSLGGESLEGAVGAYVFVCCATGSADVRLYASHEQFPVALHQFLVRVEAEHWKTHVIYVDTHSVNLSEDAEQVCALFQCCIQPVSAGTPQEMAFAESMVRTIRRMSTAMLAGAPHMGNNSWALADKYSVYIHDLLPQSTRNWHCPRYLRTGRSVDWNLVYVKVFGAPLVYCPMGGPIHKRAALNAEGHFAGIQWPAALIKRKEDGKILSCARQKMRVYESAYLAPMNQRVDHEQKVKHILGEIKQDEEVIDVNDSMDVDTGGSSRSELDNNMVQSIKSLREHRFELPGSRRGDPTTLESSAELANVGEVGGEGFYVDEICSVPEFDRLSKLVKQATDAAARGVERPSIRKQVLQKLNQINDLVMGPATQPGQLKVGKNNKRVEISGNNILEGKRVTGSGISAEPSLSDLPATVPDSQQSSSSTPDIQMTQPTEMRRGNVRIKVGDLVSCDPTLFDGDVPGSYSEVHPERPLGRVMNILKSGLTTVEWLEDNTIFDVKLRDLKREVAKTTGGSVLVMLIEGEKIAFESKLKGEWPKNFFELLVRADWRKWVEAVKKELRGWDLNQAVTVVNRSAVPHAARIVPLGELYTQKRDGTHKFRQYLMGNLLREGKDYGETFSTTVSGSGICVFFSLATTCGKKVWGWDAVNGYLQVKEQYDVFAFLPSHHEYSSLEYEDLAKLRLEFLTLMETEGIEGIKKFASKHKKDSRLNPREVYRCDAAIYGGPGCGHAFEMLIHNVHTDTCGCTQTAVEPSIFVRIVVDKEDVVVGYLVAAAWTDDLRFFGTDREVEKYKKDVSGRIKVTFEEPPVPEFVSIETYQDMERGLTELKMPKYWEKAATRYKEFFPGGMKGRGVPITPYDEKVLSTEATETEVEEAKHLPMRELLGVMSYPASNCKFELKYAISVLGSRRNAWSKKHFDVCLRVFEYGHHTRDIGLMYSKNLDPHGRNVLYAFADASLALPRPRGCTVVMLNGAAILFKTKKQTLSAASSCASEVSEFYNSTVYVKGLRNLLAELGQRQEFPTTIFQDNESAIRIVNNRGSLGERSRAIDLQTLTARNRIEDHEVRTEHKGTKFMLADMGTKALPEAPFVMFRDVMNGYALAHSAFPDMKMSPLVYEGEFKGVCASLHNVQCNIMKMEYIA